MLDDNSEPMFTPTPYWYDHEFAPAVSKAVDEEARKIGELGFCQQRVWEIVRNSRGGEMELIPLVGALKNLPQLKHKGHGPCTSGYCEYATLNFTSVTQLHKCPDPKYCTTTIDNMFKQSLLVAALQGHTMTTAWTLDGMSLVAKGKSYLAVSHVWSDGTGAGAWKAGQVNECLWESFVEIATSLGCSGVWWDTVCIPQDKATRSIALNNMHHNYAAAEYTVVHDLYLAGVEWKNDGSPCIALVLSPWFTRGWTALELLLSKRVFILFRQGYGYVLKDLDKEVLAKHQFLDSHAHWVATNAVKRLRRPLNTFDTTSDLLSVLQSRYTSWRRDQSIIAGLMCGLTDHASLTEQETTKQILVKVGNIRQNSLLHNLPTMSEPEWSWCPPLFIDLPSGGNSPFLSVGANGTLSGRWEVLLIGNLDFRKKVIWPSSAEMSIRTHVQSVLQDYEHHVILTCKSYDSQGLLVRLKAKGGSEERYCQYIAGVNFTPPRFKIPKGHLMLDVVIGYEPGMDDVDVKNWVPRGWKVLPDW